MEYIIRKMNSSEFPLLTDFLYEAIYQHDKKTAVPRSILEDPSLQIYIKDFGKYEDDYCLCAETNGTIVGAVWVRIIPGYGSVDNLTPEFAISLYKDFRGYGIGSAMMKRMLNHLKNKQYTKASLAVQKDNYALKMYLALGFQIVKETPEEYIMICYL